MSRVDDMTRLHDQVVAGHRERQSVVASLESSGDARRAAVSASRMAIMQANKDRRSNLSVSLSAFMANLAKEDKSRQKEAARLRKALAGFVHSVERDVVSLARDVAATRKSNRAMNAATNAENTAAHAAWRGIAVSGKRGAKSKSAPA